MKNEENGPDLVQLCVPLSAASLLWFLLPPFSDVQPCCNDLVPSAFPLGCTWLPTLPCFAALTSSDLFFCPYSALWLQQQPGNLRARELIVLLVPTGLCQQRLPVEAAPVVGHIPLVLPYKGSCIPPWMNLNPWVFTEIHFFSFLTTSQ